MPEARTHASNDEEMWAKAIRPPLTTYSYSDCSAPRLAMTKRNSTVVSVPLTTMMMVHLSYYDPSTVGLLYYLCPPPEKKRNV